MERRGRNRLNWENVVKADLTTCGIHKGPVEDRKSWKATIHRLEPAIAIGGTRA